MHGGRFFPPLLTVFLAARMCAQNTGATLSGRVLNSVTKAAVPGVPILLCNRSMAPPFCEIQSAPVTDDSGAFHIDGLRQGQYTVSAMPSAGFSPLSLLPKQINLSGDERVDLEITPLANLRGKVLDPDGDPAPGVVVALDRLDCDNCTAIDVSITNEDGEFAFEKLEPSGGLVLSASPKGTADPQSEQRVVTTYYPSVIDREQAEPIDSKGIDLTGYNIRLRTASAHRVRGVVLDTDGKPIAHAIVSIVKSQTAIPSMIRGIASIGSHDVPVAEPAETNGDGIFTFPSVREGDWMLRAVGGQPAQAGSAEVNVEKEDVENVELRVALQISIGMTWDWGDTPPALVEPAAAAVAFSGGIMVIDTGPDGPAFLPLDTPRNYSLLEPAIDAPEFRGFAGKYLVGPGNRAPAGFYLAAVLLDNRYVLGQVAEIAAGDSLKMIYKKDGGSVRGTVEKGDDSTIVILMADPTPTARIGYSARCDSNGAFALRDLPPGDYTAVAVQGSPRDQLGPNFLTTLAATGKRVRVESKASVQTDLRLDQ